jgi:hypothetical protein
MNHMSIISFSLVIVSKARVCRVCITTIFNESLFFLKSSQTQLVCLFQVQKPSLDTVISIKHKFYPVGYRFPIPMFHVKHSLIFPLCSSCLYKSGVCNTTSLLHFATAWFLVVFPIGGITLSSSSIIHHPDCPCQSCQECQVQYAEF